VITRTRDEKDAKEQTARFKGILAGNVKRLR